MLRRAGAFPAVTSAFLGLAGSAAAAKAYTLPRAAIHVQVLPDGAW